MTIQAVSVVAQKNLCNLGQSVKTIDFKDVQVLSALQKELCKAEMSEKEVKGWMKFVVDVCKKMNIAPKTLPVNDKFPGTLNQSQRADFCEEVFGHILDRRA